MKHHPTYAAKHATRMPSSVYLLLVAVVIANAVVTFVMIKYFLL